VTMPHLSNCEHQEFGWCLSCVGNLSDRASLAETHVFSLQSELKEAMAHLNERAIPEHITAWMAVNDDVPAKQLKCPICRNWFAQIDHLAPYHWETCYCERCELFPLRPKE